MHSGFDFILPSEHPINVGQVVCIFSDGPRVTTRRILFLQMSLFSQVAHLLYVSQSGLELCKPPLMLTSS